MNIEHYRHRFGDAAEIVMEFKKKNKGTLPWGRTYGNIRGRCVRGSDPKWKYYGGRGIECRITIGELGFTWLRDKAWTLKQPSIDRVDRSGHYEIENVRWIEMDDNRRRGKS